MFRDAAKRLPCEKAHAYLQKREWLRAAATKCHPQALSLDHLSWKGVAYPPLQSSGFFAALLDDEVMAMIPSQDDLDRKTSRLHRLLDSLGKPGASDSRAARDELIVLATEHMRALAHRMLKGFPQVRRWEETDDVVQNASLRLHRALATIVPNDESHLISLAALQIRRELLDLARRFSGPESFANKLDTNVMHGAYDESRHTDVAASDHSESHERMAVWTRFHEAIAQLPDEERQVFDLVWYVGAEQDEIGRILGCSGRTVRRRWEATKNRLLKALDGEMPQ